MLEFNWPHKLDLMSLLALHRQLVIRTCAPQPSDTLRQLVGPVGLAEEAGEVLGLFKKRVLHGHEPDREKLIGELGDLMWYLHEVLITQSVSWNEIVEANIKKVNRRYPDGFSTAASVARVDIAPERKEARSASADPAPPVID